MAEPARAFYVVYLGLAFGRRSILQRRATGSSGFIGTSGQPGSPEWLAGVLFVIAIVVGVLAPALAATGVLEPIEGLDRRGVHVTGIMLSVVGIAATLYAQVAVGSSWRIGVDPGERTQLVTAGTFALVRNPIFSAMIPTALGLVLMVPSIVAMVGFSALVLALELQVRVVEEPYLMRAQGRAYSDYSARTGRFLPGIGMLR